MPPSVILGVWDGHDSGAALLVDGTLVAAANEERFTRRKLEIAFPYASIAECLRLAGLKPEAVQVAANSTTDPAKTIGRLFPSTKESYYQIRRRKAYPGVMAKATRTAKYWLTELGPLPGTGALNRIDFKTRLRKCGIRTEALRFYDHHSAHAAGAAWTSGFDSSLVITMDGVGDGLSSSVSLFENGTLRRLASTPASDSVGIFFELITHLLNMRELEDEGKVMALADYTAPLPDEDNPFLPLVRVDGLRLRTQVPGHAMLPILRRILWRFSNEQVAYMAQRTVEKAVVQLVSNAVAETGVHRVAFTGGVASNIKASRQARLLSEIDDFYVFPHMGDGGLALGAGLLASAEAGTARQQLLDDLALGPAFSEETCREALAELPFSRSPDIGRDVATLLAQGRVVLWFEGRMEYGPRALGHRSVLARPDRVDIRDRLNMVLKRRVWYQPFCPSMLESDARHLLGDFKGSPNRHMTMGYMVLPEQRHKLAGVISADGSCRPQIVADESNTPYAALLKHVKQQIGIGAVLNTSFNIHGEPLVTSPAQAVSVFLRSGADALALGGYLTLRDHD